MRPLLLFSLNPDYLIIFGSVGFLLGILFLLIFIIRRFRWLIKIFTKDKIKLPGTIASFRNLLFILFWTATFAVILATALFLRSYYAFTWEKPIAKITIEPVSEPQTNRIILTQFVTPDSQTTSLFLIKGDQWVLEGDVLKWDTLLNYFGLHSRYRLTRIRGRYLRTQDEISHQSTIYSLIKDEDHILWRNLYQFGHLLPIVDTVYGNAIFQYSSRRETYWVYLNNTGFIARKE
jgi:hypothetical protein